MSIIGRLFDANIMLVNKDNKPLKSSSGKRNTSNSTPAHPKVDLFIGQLINVGYGAIIGLVIALMTNPEMTWKGVLIGACAGILPELKRVKAYWEKKQTESENKEG